MASVAAVAAVLSGVDGPERGDSTCACCGSYPGEVNAGRVVSRTFTGFDDWVDPDGESVCRWCAWSFTAPGVRSAMRVVWRDPARMTVATGQELCAFLTAGALPAGAAVVVPLRPGRKHVLPTARWGVVTVDDARLPWGVRDAGRLRAALRLRQLGVSQRSLSSSAPPFTLVQSLTPAARQEVLELWPHLAVWRGGTPWMQLVQRVTAGAAA